MNQEDSVVCGFRQACDFTETVYVVYKDHDF